MALTLHPVQGSNDASDSSSDSSSSDSSSDGDKQRNNRTPLKCSHPNNRKRKLSAINSNSNHNHNHNNHNNNADNNNNNNENNNNSIDLTLNGPPKKRQRISNLSINTSIGSNNDDNKCENAEENKINTNENNNNNEDNHRRSRSKDRSHHKKKKSDKSEKSEKDKKVKKERKDKKKDKKDKKSKRKKTSPPPKKPLAGVNIEDLNCTVCLELPQTKIFQCVNGHFVCETCFGRIRQGKQCLCPQCRVKMSRREPARNKLAEKYLEAALFPCPNADNGCKERIQFGYLNEHITEYCKYRIIKCKFSLLGCDWSGFAKDRRDHDKNCQTKDKPINKILKLVKNLNEEKERKQKNRDELINKYVKISKLFELRSRNIIAKDLRIKEWNSDSNKSEILNSNIFSAMRYRWQLQVMIEKIDNPKYSNNNNNHNNSHNSHNQINDNCPKLNKLKCRLMCMKQIRRRLPLEICILKGPDFGFKLEPIQFECDFTKNRGESKWIDMIPNNIYYNDEDCKDKFFTNYSTDNKMNLRLILVDKRTNGTSASFGGDNDNFNDPIPDFGIDENDFLSDLSHDDQSEYSSNNNANNNNNSNNNNNNSNNNDNNNRSHRRLSRSPYSSRSSEYTDDSQSDDDEDMYSDLDDYSSSGSFY